LFILIHKFRLPQFSRVHRVLVERKSMRNCS